MPSSNNARSDTGASASDEDAYLARVRSQDAAEREAAQAARQREGRYGHLHDCLWHCTRNGYPTTLVPPLYSNMNRVACAKVDWRSYADGWVAEAMVPAARALLAMRQSDGLDHASFARVDPIVSSQRLRGCIEVMNGPFSALLNDPDSDVVRAAVARRVSKLLSDDFDHWACYHDYFEHLAARALDELRAAAKPRLTERPTSAPPNTAPPQSSTAQPHDSAPPLSKQPSHGSDFAWMIVGEVKYVFPKPQQARVIELLYREWRAGGQRDGCGVWESTLAEGIGASSSFRVAKVFASHPILGSILRSVGKGVWALYLNEPAAPPRKPGQKKPRK